MVRSINLRQIEIFKAMIEHGTVSRAAELLYISQPAASKLLMQLEGDNGLKLFDRHKGRLTPTPQGLRLYEEIGRIFAGVRQVESAIDFIRREDQSRLVIAAIPALSGAFMQRTIMNFLKRNPNVYCSIESLSSQWIAEHLITRSLDVGVVSSRTENPYLITEPLLEHPFLCIMPIGHALSELKIIRPEHLQDANFISFKPESYTGQMIDSMFERHNVSTNVVLTANISPLICDFVAAGLGVSLVHPLFIAGIEDRVIARPFEPSASIDFPLCFVRDARNSHLISLFVEEAKATAKAFIEELEQTWQ